MSAQPKPRPIKPAQPIRRAERLRYTHVLNVRLNDEQMMALRLSAAEEGLTMSSCIREKVDAALRREHPEFFTEAES